VVEFAPLPAALADAVAAARPRFGAHVGEVRYVPSLPSTMDAAAVLADTGGAHGLVVVAGHQTAGRGSRGHTWSSPPGAGLYFSTVVRPPVAPQADGVPSLMGLLTLAAGLSVAEGVSHATGLEASLKWPNDLFYGYKLAGVLAEGHRIGSVEQHVVVGVGINVRDVVYVSGRERATSLERELGRVPDAGLVLAEVLAAWAGRYQDLLEGRYARVVDRWRIRASGLAGRPVAWVDARGEHEGTTTGVDAAGALLVDTGVEVVRITSGTVQWQ
jgi:BirA family biotin operon repressor/biotin-[acetyl-CoA-carboxylase] ligase